MMMMMILRASAALFGPSELTSSFLKFFFKAFTCRGDSPISGIVRMNLWSVFRFAIFALLLCCGVETLGRLMDVVAVDRNESALATLAPAKKDGAGSILLVPADLMQPDAFDRIVAAAMDALGRIDVLVNNAGIGQASVRADQRRNPIRFW